MPALPVTRVISLGSGLTDHCLQPRGNQEEQHLRADDDWTNLVQCNELRGVEQEGGAGHRTSHQTFKGDTSIIKALLFLLMQSLQHDQKQESQPLESP